MYRTLARWFAVLLASSALVLPLGARAEEAASTPKRDVYQASETITVTDAVTGDAYLAGSTVTITAPVAGSVYVGASSVLISGSVGGSVYAGGATLEINGAVGGNVYAAGSRVTLGKDAAVKGRIFAAGNALVLDGNVVGPAKLAGSSVTINGTVGEYADVASTTVHLGSASKIGGNLNYWSDTDVTADKGTQVSGTTTRHDPAQMRWADEGRSSRQSDMVWSFVWLLATALTAALLIALFPRLLQSASGLLSGHVAGTMLTGLGTLILAPIAAIVLMVTIIGFPLGATLFGAWLLMLYIGPMVTALWLGQLLARALKQPVSPSAAVFAGLLLLWVLAFIPGFGGLVSFLAAVTGMGALTRLARAARAKPTPAN